MWYKINDSRKINLDLAKEVYIDKDITVYKLVAEFPHSTDVKLFEGTLEMCQHKLSCIK